MEKLVERICASDLTPSMVNKLEPIPRTNRIVDGLNMGGGFIDGSYGPMKNFGEQTFNGKRLWWVYGGFRSGKELKYNNDKDRDLTPDELNAQWAGKRLPTETTNQMLVWEAKMQSQRL